MKFNWSGSVSIDDTVYQDFSAASQAVQGAFKNNGTIKLLTARQATAGERNNASDAIPERCVITVKPYMTKPATPTFDFMAKWNNNVPMPLLTMVGTKEKETKGMVYMKLHGDVTTKIMPFCLKCGKPITNPVSQYFGMGPVCGGHNYVNPFENEEDLFNAVEQYRKSYLQQITWEGWVIKSAIVSMEELK